MLANRFAGLDVEDDDVEQPPKQQKAAETAPKEKKVEKRQPRAGKDQKAVATTSDPQLPEKEKGEKRRGDMHRRGRGRGANSSFASRGRREFDRHSSRPQHRGDKKDTVGPGNWGKPGNEQGPATDAAAPAGGEKAENKDEVEEPNEPEEEEDTKTLEEYLAEKSKQMYSKQAAAPSRKVELEKGLKPLQKNEEDFFVGKSGKKERKHKERREVERIEVEPKPLVSDRGEDRPRGRDNEERGGRRGGFAGGRREGRGGRGGRGGGFSDRGRGEGGRRGEPAPQINLSSTEDFPSLS